ncbi:MAG: hypothetical protein AVDCRST_MAG60-1637 [uncultured Nocardioides sp.]|uniref:Uncharacterized protein n=1 Tax=uncultured Nocardioides sp. TaxID=198441 RepID=A0A6J4NR73_9ACTN|nr:MAG: hypothetical protein AVDCRST_MAG60-1637 [uncultured Nocardioides sp.]
MQLQSAIVPPPEVFAAALAAAHSVRVAASQVSEEPRGGLFQRLSRRATTQAPPPETSLSVVPSDHGFVRLTRFGNVSVDDTETLGIALGVAAWDWPAPVVHVSGLVLDTEPATPVVTAELGGDVEGLRTIFRKVLEVAQTQRFFLDRRIFHPRFPVATVITAHDPTIRERLAMESVVPAELQWQVTHFSLLSMLFGSGSGAFEEIAVVPLGAAG